MRPVRGEGFRRSLGRTFRHAAQIATAETGKPSKPPRAFIVRDVRAAMPAITVRFQPIRNHGDPLAYARAYGAFEEVWRCIQADIDTATVDPSLSPERRAAAIRTLRDRQKIEAEAARRRILEQEAAAAKQRRKQARGPNKPTPPG